MLTFAVNGERVSSCINRIRPSNNVRDLCHLCHLNACRLSNTPANPHRYLHLHLCPPCTTAPLQVYAAVEVRSTAGGADLVFDGRHFKHTPWASKFGAIVCATSIL